MKKTNVIALPKESYENFEIRFEYKTNYYYDWQGHSHERGWDIKLVKKSFEQVIQKEFISTLYPTYWQDCSAFGIFQEDELCAVIEMEREHWSKRLRVTEIWVDAKHRRCGLGKALMDYVVDLARQEGFRAVILETQSCNVPAIDFYMTQGFQLAGFDLSCYSNSDVQNKEIRLEFVFFLQP